MRAIIMAVAGALAIWACTVNTKTDKLACTTQADCGSSGRLCEGGFCVVDPGAKLDAAVDAKPIDAAVCPPQCASCDFPSATCAISGSGSGSGSGAAISCPSGWNCTITCGSAGTCGAIDCTAGLSCDVTCTATGAGSGTACGALTCGTGKCQQSCQGSGACADTSCANSCRCDVICNPVVGACGAMSCPMHANRICTDSMVPGAPCNSQVAQQCHSCP